MSQPTSTRFNDAQRTRRETPSIAHGGSIISKTARSSRRAIRAAEKLTPRLAKLSTRREKAHRAAKRPSSRRESSTRSAATSSSADEKTHSSIAKRARISETSFHGSKNARDNTKRRVGSHEAEFVDTKRHSTRSTLGRCDRRPHRPRCFWASNSDSRSTAATGAAGSRPRRAHGDGAAHVGTTGAHRCAHGPDRVIRLNPTITTDPAGPKVDPKEKTLGATSPAALSNLFKTNNLQRAGDRARTGDVQLGKLTENNGLGA